MRSGLVLTTAVMQDRSGESNLSLNLGNISDQKEKGSILLRLRPL